MIPLSPPSAPTQPRDASAAEAKAANGAAPANPEVVRAARQFEALFVRMMLEPLQKTAEAKKSGPGTGGGGAYGSMVVDALSDSIAESGGVGLSRMIEEALSGSRGRKS